MNANPLETLPILLMLCNFSTDSKNLTDARRCEVGVSLKY